MNGNQSSSYSIRLAGADDVDSIVSILIATKVACLGPISKQDRDVEYWTSRWRRCIEKGSTAQLATGDSFTFIAEANNQPIAFAAFHHTKRHGTDAELQSIYVLKAAQKKGIGSALLHLIGTRLVEDGSKSMCVGYSPENPFKRFYFKHGAVEIDPHWAVWRDVRKIVAKC